MLGYNFVVRRLLLLPILALVRALALADSPPAEGPALHFSGESSVAWVLVPVAVDGPSGRARKLKRSDFELRVDGRAVPVGSFEAGPRAPIRLIYLQDLSGSMANAGKLEASRRAFYCFLEQRRNGDEFALATFSSGMTQLDVPFTSEAGHLEEAARGWQGHGTTALYDALAYLSEVRSADGSLRQAAVLVTDGDDNASTLASGEARDILRAAELPVYVLDLKRRSPKSQQDSASTLHLLAVMTGGEYHAVFEDTGKKYAGKKYAGKKYAGKKYVSHDTVSQVTAFDDSAVEACAAITEELRYQYVLGFETRGSGPPAYRRIEVSLIGKKGFSLSHRRGYSGLPPLLPSSVHPNP